MKTKAPKVTMKQEGGNDGYCYAIRVDGRLVVNGLCRREALHYKKLYTKKAEREIGIIAPQAT